MLLLLLSTVTFLCFHSEQTFSVTADYVKISGDIKVSCDWLAANTVGRKTQKLLLNAKKKIISPNSNKNYALLIKLLL